MRCASSALEDSIMQILTFLFSMRELRRGITVGENYKKVSFWLLKFEFWRQKCKGTSLSPFWKWDIFGDFSTLWIPRLITYFFCDRYVHFSFCYYYYWKTRFRKKIPSKLWIYLLDPFDSLEFWDWTLVTDVDIGLVPELVVDVGDDCLVLDQSRHSCCNNKSIFDTLSKEIRQV